MNTIKTLIESFKADGIAQAISDNKASAKRSTIFFGVGRSAYIAMLNVIVTDDDDGTLEVFKHQDNALLILSAYADAYRDRLLDKNHLYEALGYMVRGFNAEAIVQHNKTEASPLLVVHCYSVKQNTPAQFTFNAKPAKAPKVKTASGKSDAPTGNAAPDSSNSTPEKGAAIIEAGLPININDVKNAVKNGQITLKELAQLVDEITAGKLSTLFNMDFLTDVKKSA